MIQPSLGTVDEHRKMLWVTVILDDYNFRATWRGREYECRAIPGTASLASGDVVICHALPGSTQLLAIVYT